MSARQSAATPGLEGVRLVPGPLAMTALGLDYSVFRTEMALYPYMVYSWSSIRCLRRLLLPGNGPQSNSGHEPMPTTWSVVPAIEGLPDPVQGRTQPRSVETWLLAIAEAREGTWCPITKQQRRGVLGKNDKDKLGPKTFQASKAQQPGSFPGGLP
ncbi:uncharacterized protein TrAtP1_005560 [Trichoderma atroviride]|uniref:Uncharacterized protein n=1 Tax=Hypocrea atroviridis (strain ATCC 20476 / IMI 206040) TaxID=452589 RepID=G9NSU7_HYPAI|nr:uncharacterized protein TRIATDRAFT_307299 [Trichoderma atroviride IMI 206040]EHK46492.1 hypothetical protein TRIATDRAFT_307299 [Trichoderma atroviride IMI 206040]UKZ64344.1 hypothetical protein TrAtP1_005560 [Trichoderma atroviride]